MSAVPTSSAARPTLYLRQHSPWSAFRFDVLDAGRRAIGAVEWPAFPQARNARLRVHPRGSPEGDLRLSLRGRALRLRYEYTRRAFWNDIRWTLDEGGRALASFDALSAGEGRTRPAYPFTVPFAAELVRTARLPRSAFALVAKPGGGTLARVEEPSWLALRRELAVYAPRLDEAVAVFVAYAALARIVGR